LTQILRTWSAKIISNTIKMIRLSFIMSRKDSELEKSNLRDLKAYSKYTRFTRWEMPARIS
jgi:hypothetical protein